jgi:Cu/Ag efflux protein CusF
LIRFLLATTLLATVVACGRSELPPADATYTARGQVMTVPDTAAGELVVHHETIAGFRSRAGKPEHMDSMSMPFALAPGVSLAGVAPGDKVEMSFEVRWENGPPLRIVALRELPETTVLQLGGPTLELVAPLGSKPRPTAAAAPTPTIAH